MSQEETINYTLNYALSDIYDVYTEVAPLSSLRIVFFVLGAAGCLLGIFIPQAHFILLYSCICLAMPFVTAYMLKRSAKKTLESPWFSAPLSVSMDNVGVTLHGKDVESKQAWNQFPKWRETKTAILLYPTPYIFQIIPKRCLSPEQQEATVKLVSSNIKSTASSKNQVIAFAIFFAIMLVIGFISGLTSAHH